VRVSGLTASQTFTVQVDGTAVGSLTTDANGRGKLTLSDLSATIAAGSVVTVLDSSGATVLQGTFATPSNSGCHGDDSGEQRLTASLTSSSSTESGHAVFRSSASDTSQNSLTMRVSGLTASQTYTIQIGGTDVGSLTTDANGRGKVTLSNLSVSVAAGSVLTVVDSSGTTVLQGTFATATGGEHHGWGHGFLR
jgi:hypothetical protein